MFGGAAPESLAGSEERINGSALFVKDATRVPNLLMHGLGVQPNLRFASPQPNIFFAQFDHGPTRFFFLRNPKPASQDVRVAIPGRGVIPEIWDAWTGRIASAPQYIRSEGELLLDLHLDPYGSILLSVREGQEALHAERSEFRQVRSLDGRLMALAARPGRYRATLSNGKTVQANISKDQLPGALTLGPNWFLHALGKDKDGKEYTREYHLTDLKDWTLEPDLRSFSGHGHYTLDFDLKPEYLRPGLELALDLGEVHDVAEVLINQTKVATLLLRPYRVDVISSLHTGTNHLEVIVQNTLRNRMVGDGVAGDPNFVVFRNRMFYLPSGMIGPVRLIPARQVELR
jgi:hypothetical protein